MHTYIYIYTYIHIFVLHTSTHIYTYIHTYIHDPTIAGDAKCLRITLTSPFIVIVKNSALMDGHQCEPDMVIVEDSQTDDPDMDTDGHAGAAPNTVESWWDRWNMNSALLFERRIPLIVR